MSFETRRPGQGQEEPVYFATVSVTSLPNLLDIGGFLFLLTFVFLLSLPNLVRSVANLLNARIDLLQFHIWGITGRKDLRHRLFHWLRLSCKALHKTIQFFSPVLPKLSSILGVEIFRICEIHARLELI